jgi:hypothetical protein
MTAVGVTGAAMLISASQFSRIDDDAVLANRCKQNAQPATQPLE